MSLFDHLNEIHGKQRPDYWERISDADKKTWNNWMINRFISMNMSYVPVVNEIQKYYNEVQDNTLYLFYSQIFPKSKQYNKYIKSAKDEPYDKWLLELISKHYMISHTESSDYLDIFYQTDESRERLKRILQGYGVDPKQIKKVKL